MFELIATGALIVSAICAIGALLWAWLACKSKRPEVMGVWDSSENAHWGDYSEREKKAWVAGALGALHREGRELRELHVEGRVDTEHLYQWERKTYDLLQGSYGSDIADQFREEGEIPPSVQC